MKWCKLLSALLLLTPLAAVGQFTQVQGTVIDPKGTPYANGTITPFLIISGSPRFASSGFPYVPPNQATGLDSHGFFIMSLADVTQILPSGGLWTFHICSGAGTIPPAGGAGPVCFDTPGLTISGTVQDISTPLQAAAKPLTGPGGGGSGSGTVSTGTPPQFAIYTGPTTVASTPRWVDNTINLNSTVPIEAQLFISNTSGALTAACTLIQNGFQTLGSSNTGLTQFTSTSASICANGVESGRWNSTGLTTTLPITINTTDAPASLPTQFSITENQANSRSLILLTNDIPTTLSYEITGSSFSAIPELANTGLMFTGDDHRLIFITDANSPGGHGGASPIQFRPGGLAPSQTVLSVSPDGNGTVQIGSVKGTHITTSSAGNDIVGTCTGTATTCTVTFTEGWGTPPICVATPTSTVNTEFSIVTTVNGFTITYNPSETITFNYICMGNPN